MPPTATDLRVADLMTIDPIAVSVDASIRTDGRPIGVISAMDFVALAAEG